METLPTDVLLYPVSTHEGHKSFFISITGKEDVMTLKSIYRVKRIFGLLRVAKLLEISLSSLNELLLFEILLLSLPLFSNFSNVLSILQIN